MSTFLLALVAGFAGLVVLFRYALLPLFVYRVQTLPAHYAFAEVPVDEVLAERGLAFQDAHMQLQALGFEPVKASGFSLSSGASSFVLYRKAGDTATATLMAFVSAQSETVVTDFTQVYADGVNLSLTNGPVPETFPRWRRKIRYRAPGVGDIAALFHRFTTIVTKLDRPGAVALPVGRELETVADYLNDEVRALAESGHTRPGEHAEQLRLSLRGAYVSCWKLMWPGKALLNGLASLRVRLAG